MRMLKINVTRLFISTVMMGFLVIYLEGVSIVEAGDKNPDLIEAVTQGRSDVVKRLLTEGADVNASERDGATALRWAYKWNRPTIVKILKAHGARE